MLEKFHLRGAGNQDPGDPGVGKVRGGERFFFLQAGGGLTLDDTMFWFLTLFYQKIDFG